jgi:hypothetical protein
MPRSLARRRNLTVILTLGAALASACSGVAPSEIVDPSADAGTRTLDAGSADTGTPTLDAGPADATPADAGGDPRCQPTPVGPFPEEGTVDPPEDAAPPPKAPAQFEGPGLQTSAGEPFLDNGAAAGTGTFKVDLTPAAKAALEGSGSIEVTIAPHQQPLADRTWTTEIVGPSTVTIAYQDGETTPATVRFRRAHWMPNDANEFESQLSWISVSTRSDSAIGEQRLLVAGLSRGSYLATVRDYIERHRHLGIWFDVHLALHQGRYLDQLVQYMVSEDEFVAWAGVANNASTLAFGSALGYRPEALTEWRTDSISGGRGVYTLEAFGWPSSAAYDELVEDYVARVRPVNDSFSFSTRNRVPVDYFLEKLEALPAGWNFAQKDFEVASLYHKEGAEQRLEELGLGGLELLEEFAVDYNLRQFCPVPPHAVEAMALTHTDPSYRRDAPLALIAVNRDLERGTFSEADIIGTIARTHRLVIAEARDSAQLMSVARTAHARHGAFDLVACVGHGTDTTASCLHIEDRPAFTELAGMLAPGATVMLASCSGAAYNPLNLSTRLAGTGSRAVHIAAAMQAAMPAARVVAATDLIQKSMITFDPTATSPERRHRVAYVGSGVWGDIPGTALKGTPRDWLRREFGPGHDWDALESADPDGDGDPTWLEYRAGTNPRSAEDVLRVELRADPMSGAALLRWRGTYRNGAGDAFRLVFTPEGGAPQVVAERIERAVRGMNHWRDTRRGSGVYSIEGFPSSGAAWKNCD